MASHPSRALMASLDEVAAQLRAVLDNADDAAALLVRVAEALDELVVAWSVVITESTSVHAAEAGRQFRTARDAAEETRTLVHTACQAVTDYHATLLGTSSAANTDGRSVPSVSEPRRVSTRHADAFSAARRRLGRGTPGSQTHGEWVKPDGTIEEIHSGTDTPWYQAAQRELQRLGGPAGRALARLASHVEVQFVIRMREHGMTSATLVLDREPCGSPPRRPQPFTCDAQLGNLIRALLPSGAYLRVVDPDGTGWVYPKETTR